MKVANAPCSWGILEFGLDGKTDEYQKMLDEMSNTGYTGTELGDWGFLPTEPKTLKRELSSRSLQLAGAFVPVNFSNKEDHAAGLETALKTARLLADVHGQEAFVVLSDENGKNPVRISNAGRIRPEHGLPDRDWSVFTSGVEFIAEKLQNETGIRSVFHHHCAGYIETPDEIRTLLKRTDPELVSLCFDTGHYEFGGGNALQGLIEHADRIRHVHFKDFDPELFQKAVNSGSDYFEAVEKGVFCELGMGSIPFRKILKELQNRHYSGWIVVEQDVLPGMGSPRESAYRNRKYLRSIGL